VEGLETIGADSAGDEGGDDNDSAEDEEFNDDYWR
jgi:hypothetical protein